MKTCSNCKISKDESEFYTYKRKDRTTLYARCKPCHLAGVTKKVSAENKRKYRNEHRARQVEEINKVKSVPCMDCGLKYPPYVMDLDHVIGDKYKNVAKMVGRYSMEAIMEEVAKCEVVCSNCHRIRTHNRIHASVVE